MADASEESETLRVRTGDVLWQELEDEVVLLDLRTSRYLSLNESGKGLWKQLVEGATKSELAGALVDAFSISRERAETDVDRFVQEVRERGLLDPE